MSKRSETKVLVFGVFDKFHKGHEYFLREAKKYGDVLIISVAQDETVQYIKGHPPEQTLNERVAKIEAQKIAHRIIPGDRRLNTWSVIHTYQPHIIVIGHDQDELKIELKKRLQDFPSIKKIIQIKPFKRDKYRSSNIIMI